MCSLEHQVTNNCEGIQIFKGSGGIGVGHDGIGVGHDGLQ